MRKSTFISIALTAVSFLMAGCYHDYHELRESEFGNLPVGYVAPLIDWEQEDATVPVRDLTIVAVGSGLSYSKSYAQIPDFAKDPLIIPIGEYTVLSMVNMTESDGYIVTDDMTVSFKDSAKVPGQAWFGVTNTIIREDTMVIAETTLQHLLSVLKLNMTNVPEGTSITFTLGNVAQDIKLKNLDESGRYGLPSIISRGDMTVGTLTAGTDGMINSDELLLPPTVFGLDSTDITLGVKLADGNTFNCSCTVPRTDIGWLYSLDFDFDSLSTSMKFTSNSVGELENAWTAVPDDSQASAYPVWRLAVPLTIEAMTAGAQVRFTLCEYIPANSVQFRTGDGTAWSDWTDYIGGSDILLENEGDMVQFRGNNETYAYYSEYYSNFSFTDDCYVYGNVMSLISGSDLSGCNTLRESDVFFRLFYNDSLLHSHPTKELLLPATKIAWDCYEEMFKGCTSLTRAPKLPATKLYDHCYDEMFSGCSSLTDIPEDMLPATTLDYSCYKGMFKGCTSLTAIPENFLPATKVFSGSYSEMFWGCTSLTLIPENLLPATTLANWCYSDMFCYCTGLTSIPDNLLPATTMTYGCYSGMFSGCTSLTTVPENLLPATTLAEVCYSYMFSECTGMTTLPGNLLPATTLKSRCYFAMFSDCTGLTTLPGNLLPATTLAEACYGAMFVSCTGLTTLPESLLPATKLENECYDRMFTSCTGLTTLPGNLLPATELAWECYYYMFSSCSGLTTLPGDLLPATTLAVYSYVGMFHECTGLTVLPENLLPATTLGEFCYSNLFSGCSGLTTVPENLLPATTLAKGCYFAMFARCQNLISAPDLVAENLVEDCYVRMFMECSKLNSVKCLATNVNANNKNNSLFGWLDNVSESGTFTAHLIYWIDADDYIPVGWTRAYYDE